MHGGSTCWIGDERDAGLTITPPVGDGASTCQFPALGECDRERAAPASLGTGRRTGHRQTETPCLSREGNKTHKAKAGSYMYRSPSSLPLFFSLPLSPCSLLSYPPSACSRLFSGEGDVGRLFLRELPMEIGLGAELWDAGKASRRPQYRPAAPPSPFRRRINRDEEGAPVK